MYDGLRVTGAANRRGKTKGASRLPRGEDADPEEGSLTMPVIRSDRKGSHQRRYRENRKRILMSESVCAICKRPVDMSLKPPDPMSPTVDHIIPVSKGGHPSDINNLQLAHWICNRMKSDKLISVAGGKEKLNRNIKLSCDWRNF